MQEISNFSFSYISPLVIVSDGKKVPSDKIASPSVNVQWSTINSTPEYEQKRLKRKTMPFMVTEKKNENRGNKQN